MAFIYRMVGASRKNKFDCSLLPLVTMLSCFCRYWVLNEILCVDTIVINPTTISMRNLNSRGHLKNNNNRCLTLSVTKVPDVLVAMAWHVVSITYICSVLPNISPSLLSDISYIYTKSSTSDNDLLPFRQHWPVNIFWYTPWSSIVSLCAIVPLK